MEVRQWLDHRDHGDGVAELGVQATENVEHQRVLGDGVTHVVQEISELLELADVRHDGHVTLEQTVKLLQGIDSPLVNIVEEVAAHGRPESVRRGLAQVDHLHQG